MPLRLALILLPLTTTAARLHGHALDAPDLAAQEVNRCLKLVKIAASRRQSDRRTASDRRDIRSGRRGRTRAATA